MNAEGKKTVRWLSVATAVLLVALVLMQVLFANRLSTVSSGLQNSLYRDGVAPEHVDKVNQALFSILIYVQWMGLAAMFLTGVGSALLIGIIKKHQHKSNLESLSK